MAETAYAAPSSERVAGSKQALLVVVLAGEAARSDLLAFSVGMRLVIVTTNVIAGFVAIGLILRTFRYSNAFRPPAGDARGP